MRDVVEYSEKVIKTVLVINCFQLLTVSFNLPPIN